METGKYPAFPIVTGMTTQAIGLTIREYYAAKVMQAMITGIDTDEKFRRYRRIAKEKGLSVSEWIDNESFKQADAMIKQSEP